MLVNNNLIKFLSSTYPSGFRYIPNFITGEEQHKLIEIANKNQWCDHLQRHQQYYGIKYFQTKYADSKLQNIYSKGHHDIHELDFIIKKIKDNTSSLFRGESPNQILVNRYLKKDYLGFHVEDIEAFGAVIMGLSIGSLDYLRLTPAITERNWAQTPKQYYQGIDRSKQIKVKLENRSLYILSGEARFKWRHGIGRTVEGKKFKDENFMRISFTFRDVLETRRKIIDSL